MKKVTLTATALMLLGLVACNSNKEYKVDESKSETLTGNVESNQYDPNKGEGKFNYDNVKLTTYLDEKMANRGEDLYIQKCASCHSVDTTILKAPGWKGVTERRTAHWIMNYIVNPEGMLDKDQKLINAQQVHGLRMPNMKLSDTEARDLLEYMRKIDGVQPVK